MHGLTLTDSTTAATTLAAASLSTIGIVATADDADAATFPLDTPVLISDVAAAIEKAGTEGTLAAALTAISEQTSPVLVVVRVATGADDAETTANVIGTSADGTYTGLQALKAAKSVVGVAPRILGAPGLDTQTVAAELVTIAKKLRGMVYAKAIGDTLAEAVAYRANFTAREIMLIWPDSSEDFAGDIIARALGLRALIDAEQGWQKTISNVKLTGIDAITKHVDWDLLDGSTDAGTLNDAQITTIIRNDGWRLWGNRTCVALDGDDAASSFESAVRTSYALQDMLMDTIFPYVDKPMTLGLIKYLLEIVNKNVAQYVTDGKLIGGRFEFDATANTSTQLAAGKPKFNLTYTPCSPLENPIVELISTDEYYADFADQLT